MDQEKNAWGSYESDELGGRHVFHVYIEMNILHDD